MFHPSIPGYPHARFPGVVVFSEIYQGTYPDIDNLDVMFLQFGEELGSDATSGNRTLQLTAAPCICTVTGPVARFARQIAGQGYICAAPSSYHEFTGPEPLAYNAEDTDKGNQWKVSKVGTALSPRKHGVS